MSGVNDIIQVIPEGAETLSVIDESAARVLDDLLETYQPHELVSWITEELGSEIQYAMPRDVTDAIYSVLEKIQGLHEQTGDENFLKNLYEAVHADVHEVLSDEEVLRAIVDEIVSIVWPDVEAWVRQLVDANPGVLTTRQIDDIACSALREAVLGYLESAQNAGGFPMPELAA